MGCTINLFIVTVVLIIKHVISNFYQVSSYGENVLTTKLLNGSIFVLMIDKQNENQRTTSKYVIISSDKDIISEEHVLSDCVYTEKANLQTLSNTTVVLVDNNKFYLINYTNDTCNSKESNHFDNDGNGITPKSMEDSILERVALAVNTNKKEFIIGDARENSKQIVLYNEYGEKQQFINFGKNINHLECGVIGKDIIKYI